jgi:hypothetical protein
MSSRDLTAENVELLSRSALVSLGSFDLIEACDFLPSLKEQKWPVKKPSVTSRFGFGIR